MINSNAELQIRSLSGLRQLSSLNADVLLQILSYLSVQGILNVRQTCRTLRDITHIRAVWNIALVDDVLAKDLPMAPWSGHLREQYQNIHIRDHIPLVSSFSASELECLTRRSLALRVNWQNGRPVRCRTCVVPPHVDSQYKWTTSRLRFLHRQGREFLVGYSRRPQMTGMRLCIWDLSPKEPTLVGYWSTIAYASTFHMNTVSTSEGLWAVSDLPVEGRAEVQILTFDEDEPDPYASIAPLNQTLYQGVARLLHLHDNMLLMTLQGGERTVAARDWTNGQLIYTFDSGLQLASQCLAIRIIGDFALLFRESSLSVYRTNQSPPSTSSTISAQIDQQAINLKPVANYNWTSKLNTLTVTERVLYSSRCYNHTYKSLSILARFDSFGFAENLIHHFVLSVDPCYDGTTLHPYIFPPIVQAIIPSAIHFFGWAGVLISPFGLAIWHDSDTDSSASTVNAVRMQRIAGKPLGLSVNRNDVAANESRVTSYASTNQIWASFAMNEQTGRLALADAGRTVEVWEFI